MPFAGTTRLFFAEATPYLVCVAALAFAASIVALWRERRRAQKWESEFLRLPMLQKKAVCIIAFSAIASLGSATNVIWDAVITEYSPDHIQMVSIWLPPESWDYATNGGWPYLGYTGNTLIGVELNGDNATLTIDPDGWHILSGCPGAWIQANLGDSVSSETMFNQSAYFLDELAGNVSHPFSDSVSAYAVVGEPNYFKIAIQDNIQYSDYLDIFRTGVTPDFIPDTYYGWIEYIIDDQGNMSILNSAIGLDGQTMVVGAIPEPSTTALMLIGLVAVGACRRRAVTNHT